MELDDIKQEAARLSPLAHFATVGGDGKPDVVPVHPAWEGDTLWIMTAADSVKARNVAANPDVAIHWQVGPDGDGVELWGVATAYHDTDTKRRLWSGVFDYDLDAFASDGPDSPEITFIAVTPERAVALKQFGMAGRATWQRA